MILYENTEWPINFVSCCCCFAPDSSRIPCSLLQRNTQVVCLGFLSSILSPPADIASSSPLHMTGVDKDLILFSTSQYSSTKHNFFDGSVNMKDNMEYGNHDNLERYQSSSITCFAYYNNIDRELKFHRSAHIWIIIACGNMVLRNISYIRFFRFSCKEKVCMHRILTLTILTSDE